MADSEIFEEEMEYQIFEVEGDEGEVYEFALTDMIEYEDRLFAICNLVEGDEITGAYVVYEAIVSDEDKTIDLEELDEETEDLISDLYYKEFIAEDDEEDEEEEN